MVSSVFLVGLVRRDGLVRVVCLDVLFGLLVSSVLTVLTVSALSTFSTV
jgi:hypothetical protein